MPETIVKRLAEWGKFFSDSKDFIPCKSSVEWLGQETDPEKAWNECPRADWLFWAACRADIDNKLLASIACDCAETALQYVPAGEDRPAKAIETTRKWLSDEAAWGEVVEARADSLALKTPASTSAAFATEGYAACAYEAACAAKEDKDQALKEMCELVRKRISFADIAKGLDI